MAASRVVDAAFRASAVRSALTGWHLRRDEHEDTFTRAGWTVRFDRLQDRLEIEGPDTSLLWGGVDPAAVPALVTAIGGPASAAHAA